MRAMDPYRGGQVIELWCPRCKTTKLPPLDVATCGGCRGVWVTAFASSVVLSASDLRRSHVSWWRVREHCPLCDERMQTFGDAAVFQGCEDHGYFIDADVVPQTGLANGIDHTAIEKKRAEWPAIPLDPELVRRAQRASADRKDEREREQEREAERRQRHVEELERLDKIEKIANSDSELVEALRPAIGEIAAEALLMRLRSLNARIDNLAARINYL
jgi:hypothetical protein